MSPGHRWGTPPRAWVRAAHLTRLRGSILEAPLTDVRIGEMCVIRERLGRSAILGRAQVVGFTADAAVLALLGCAQGLSREVVIEPTGAPLSIRVSTALLGRVVDAQGQCCGVLGQHVQTEDTWVEQGRTDAPIRETKITAAPITEMPIMQAQMREIETPRRLDKLPVSARFETGVRVIDGVLGVGVGQRVVVLAPAGVGKTSLLHTIVAQGRADVCVVALIGERGREVSETIDRLGEGPAARQCVLVRASSDAPAVERMAAAASAMTIAEYFRDQGRHVLLVFDSLTRYARALREVALAAGELPARHGYPASVFEQLPRMLERAGHAGQGAITAFFSVLVEHDDEFDPIAHEVVSIVDGHFVLSAALANEGHFPAIDIGRSVSRVESRIATADDIRRASAIRQVFARAAQLEMLVEIGEYRPGALESDDRALACASRLKALFRQRGDQRSTLEATRGAIDCALA